MLNLLTERSILKLKLFGYTSGTFGQVLECWDRERKEMVAIKIIRGIKKYRDAAMIEIGMLEQLGKYEKSRSSCVQIRNWFDYRNHICIVCEKLGPSLYDFLRKNSYRSFPIALVREVAKQLLECIACVCTVPSVTLITTLISRSRLFFHKLHAVIS